MPFWGAGLQPAPPDGYQFDYINADVLLHLMSVNQQGKLILPGGMTYSLLVLPQTNMMTLPMIQKIRELVARGATIVGPRPIAPPGLTNYPTSDSVVKEIAFDVWGDLDGISRTRRRYGTGKIAWGLSLQQLLNEGGVSKDATFDCNNDQVSWIHRRNGNIDIYFVVNRTNAPLDLLGRFRVMGKDVELWHPDNGSIEPASNTMDDSTIKVSIQLAAHDAVFVVFKDKSSQGAPTLSKKQYTELKELTGGWDINFPKGWGAPSTIKIPQLRSWTESSDSGIKYFSGTATYSKTFEIKPEWLKRGNRIILDLGVVKDMAEVYVNGTRVDFLWKSPFKADITGAVRSGTNKLQILVTNEWTNRLAGDKEHPDQKILDSYPPPFGRRQYEVSASGLIGPVKLFAERDIIVNTK
jgi:hypothetical protein